MAKLADAAGKDILSKPGKGVGSTPTGDIICWRGSMAEQLICNQQVVGSTPIASSIKY